MNEIIARLKEQGYRLTSQRKAIVLRVTEAAEPLTAILIWQSVRQEYPNISLDTVYRNLNVLAEMGILIPIGSAGKDGVRYELVHSAHHHHIVCVKCGQSRCIDYCPVNQDLLDIVHASGYDLIRHTVEFFGVCAVCQNTKGALE
ncbi:hypothetical protein P22_2300 [Propionispora sp. 2/2-37]|uniref:Fur family transcriptional regulator n=1 Tax=Propionispora sp. 2/2-37 TaxID=1677858 RepID=UPI0006BB6948|nr:Fur family transcriptional regulator [Propionispora sp. 2/2-37]CUH96211.1 hypothetical protein P22_2300 [Propionispora sp. 2/2-37]